MSSFTKLPRLKAIPPEYKLYEVPNAFRYYIGSENSKEFVEIPDTFITDGASIPQWAWSIIGGPLGKYAPAAVVHDYLYKYKLYTRKRCDEIFLEAMKVLGVSWIKRYVMFWAVRGFAWYGWNLHRNREK